MTEPHPPVELQLHNIPQSGTLIRRHQFGMHWRTRGRICSGGQERFANNDITISIHDLQRSLEKPRPLLSIYFNSKT
jgi:hypothetical protein